MGTLSTSDGLVGRAATAVRSGLLEIAGIAGIGPRQRIKLARRESKLPEAPDAVLLRPLTADSQSHAKAPPAPTATRTAPNIGRKRFVILLAVLLYLFGTIMVMSAKSGTAALAGGDQWEYFKRQLVFGFMGFSALLIALHIPLTLVRRLARVSVVVAVLMLFLVFVPGLGINANGATRWLNFGVFQMQPSELIKVSMILLIADHLARVAPPRHWLRDFLRSPAGVGFALCIVIVAQHDLGSSLVVGSIVLGMYLAAGTSPKLLAQTIGPAVALVILSIIAMPFRRQRFLAFLDPWEDPHGPGYQLVQALVAIGSGGVFGVGLGHSVEKIHYLPEAHTDMIFSIVAEELGLLGVAIVLLAFTSLAIVGGRIAVKAKDRFHSLLAVGLTILLCVQAVINLGGVVGVLPLTGVPLPLVSYGGSSMIVMLFCLGLLANVASAPSLDSSPEPAR